MDFNQRLEKLKMLLSAAGATIAGRKKLQKLAYLCQAAGEPLGQNFTFHHYGVYSPTLADDIQAAASMGLVEERDGLGTVVTVLPAPVKVDQTRGFNLVNQLKNEEARMLEVLSTIVYLHSQGYSGVNLKEKLLVLKGKHSEFFAKAFDFAAKEFSVSSIS